jgi:hypothetical protein
MSTFINSDSENWVLIDSNADFTDYYLQDSVIRDAYTIKVLVKRIYKHTKEKIDLLNSHTNKNNFDIIHHSLLLYSIDYIEYKYCIDSILHYNEDSVLLVNVNLTPKCKEIKPDSEVEFIFKQIINEL